MIKVSYKKYIYRQVLVLTLTFVLCVPKQGPGHTTDSIQAVTEEILLKEGLCLQYEQPGKALNFAIIIIYLKRIRWELFNP